MKKRIKRCMHKTLYFDKNILPPECSTFPKEGYIVS